MSDRWSLEPAVPCSREVDEDLISEFRSAGVEPLKIVTATRSGHLVALDSGDGCTVEVDGDHAHAIQVELLP